LVDVATTLPSGSPEAIAMMVELQNILQRDAAGIGLWDMKYLRVLSSSLKGYRDNAAYPNVVFWYDCYRE
jgi:peptide/nickel transport system substrate-binding protein